MTAKFFRWSAALLGLTVAISLGRALSSAQYGHRQRRACASDRMRQRQKSREKAQKVNKAEEAAYKDVLAAQGGDPAMQIQVGEDFITKFPMSKYLGGVYGMLTTAYYTTGNTERCSPREPRRSNSIPTTWMCWRCWRWPSRAA